MFLKHVLRFRILYKNQCNVKGHRSIIFHFLLLQYLQVANSIMGRLDGELMHQSITDPHQFDKIHRRYLYQRLCVRGQMDGQMSEVNHIICCCLCLSRPAGGQLHQGQAGGELPQPPLPGDPHQPAADSDGGHQPVRPAQHPAAHRQWGTRLHPRQDPQRALRPHGRHRGWWTVHGQQRAVLDVGDGVYL